MPTSLSIATLSWENRRWSLEKRLAWLEGIIANAVRDGAQLVLLPAYFNGAYSYDDSFSLQTEAHDGVTLNFMYEQARHHQIYLAGAFLLKDTGDVTISAYICAPDGRSWRYDQQYPLLWERAYAREGARPFIAHTPIGRIGMMIGWDIVHPDIWERYAGRVDMLLIMGAIPDFEAIRFIAEDETSVILSKVNPMLPFIAREMRRARENLPELSRWLNVPVIGAGLWGFVRSDLPASRYSAYALLWGQHGLLQIFGETYQAEIPLHNLTQIFSPDGDTSNASGIGERLQTTITLPDVRPQPLGDMPETRLPFYLGGVMLPIVGAGLALNYRRIVRRQWGARMGQEDAKTRWWRGLVVGGAVIGLVAGFFVGRSKR